MECPKRILFDKAEAFTQYMKARHSWAEEIRKVPLIQGVPVRPYLPPPDLEALYGQWRLTVCRML